MSMNNAICFRPLPKTNIPAMVLPMQGKDIDVLIGRNLRVLREASKLSQVQLADLIGSESTRLSAYETGREGMGKDIMARVCNALGVQPWEFYVTEQTPCIIDEKERQILYTIREAERMGVAEDIARYGQFRIAEAKKTKPAAARKSRGAGNKGR